MEFTVSPLRSFGREQSKSYENLIPHPWFRYTLPEPFAHATLHFSVDMLAASRQRASHDALLPVFACCHSPAFLWRQACLLFGSIGTLQLARTVSRRPQATDGDFNTIAVGIVVKLGFCCERCSSSRL